ncbi:MAG: M56 family metallopeptidase [Acidobacteriota bacterium]|nr:M56 family metallopeptidase [Acidobacteriota bacterium]
MIISVPFLYWTANYTLHLLLFGLLAMVLEKRLTAFPARDFLWKAVLWSTPVSASLAMWFTTGFTLDMPAAFAQPGALATAAPATQPPTGVVLVERIGEEVIASWSFFAWIAFAWTLVAAVRLIQMSLSLWRLHRLPRTRGLVDERLSGLLRALTTQAGCRRRLRVLAVDGLEGPLALAGGTILVPERALTLSDDRLRALLGHEMAHQIRRDPEWLAFWAVLEAVFFFNPMIGVLRNRFRDNAELICDHLAVTHLHSPIHLAECLAEVARWIQTPQSPAMAGMAETKSGLAGRVQAILKPEKRTFRGLPLYIRALLLLIPIAFGLMLPAFKQPDSDDGTRTSVNILTSDHKRFNIRADALIQGNGAVYRFLANGLFEFADDDSEVTWASPGAVLIMEEEKGGVHYRAELKRRFGKVSVTWKENGRERPLKGPAKTQYQNLLTTFIREINVYDIQRAYRILNREGPEALELEIERTIHPELRERYRNVLLEQR